MLMMHKICYGVIYNMHHHLFTMSMMDRQDGDCTESVSTTHGIIEQ